MKEPPAISESPGTKGDLKNAYSSEALSINYNINIEDEIIKETLSNKHDSNNSLKIEEEIPSK